MTADMWSAAAVEVAAAEFTPGNLSTKFVEPPFSVLDSRGGRWQDRRRAWLSLGIKSELGRGADVLFEQGSQDRLNDLAGTAFPATSIFDPVLCELAYRWFAPEGGAILDPFAGGSVRGIVAAKLGHQYTGIDLATEQLAANRDQATTILQPGEPLPIWHQGDSAYMDTLLPAGQQYDMVFSCPPYFDLEVYSDDPADLSGMPWGGFMMAYDKIIEAACARLRPQRFAVFVVSEVRSPDGSYRGLVPHTIRAFEQAGMRYYNEAILVNSAGTLPLRAAKAMEASRKLGRCHQNVLVFVKGEAPRGWSYDRTPPPDPQLDLALLPDPLPTPPAQAAPAAAAPVVAPVGADGPGSGPGALWAGGPDVDPPNLLAEAEAMVDRAIVGSMVDQWNSLVPPDATVHVVATQGEAPQVTVEAPPSVLSLTPVQQVGRMWVKRDDLFEYAGVRGGKVRTCRVLAYDGTQVGLVTAGSRSSPQVNIVAHVAAAMGLPCRVHTPTGTLSPEVAQAQAEGAEVVQHKAGYNSVIVARARDDAAALGWTLIPFGMECQEAVNATAGQVRNLPPEAERIVVPVGSGMSLAGILHGLADAGRALPVLGVVVGADPTKRLDAWAPADWRAHVTLVPSGSDYHEAASWTTLQAPGGAAVELDAHYEAKCLGFLRPGDLLWVVGIRATQSAPLAPRASAERSPGSTELPEGRGEAPSAEAHLGHVPSSVHEPDPEQDAANEALYDLFAHAVTDGQAAIVEMADAMAVAEVTLDDDRFAAARDVTPVATAEGYLADPATGEVLAWPELPAPPVPAAPPPPAVPTDPLACTAHAPGFHPKATEASACRIGGWWPGWPSVIPAGPPGSGATAPVPPQAPPTPYTAPTSDAEEAPLT